MEDGGSRMRHLYWQPGTDAHGHPFDGCDQSAAPVVATKGGVCTVPCVSATGKYIPRLHFAIVSYT
jgi:hypothetical protein